MKRVSRPVLILVAGLVLIAGGVVAAVVVARLGDDGPNVSDTVRNGGPASKSKGGTVGGTEVLAQIPASRFGILLQELPANFQVNVSDTFTQNISTFSTSYWFKTEAEGSQKANDWRIIDGFNAVFQPKGLIAEVTKGSYYLTVETYMFLDVAGAQKAWAHYDNVLKSTTGSDAVDAKPLANNSNAFQIIQGTVGPSEMVGIYHRFSFRRGNTIVSVQTWGGQPYMNIDPARDLAVMIDEKLLGARPAAEPTAVPTPGFVQPGGRP